MKKLMILLTMVSIFNSPVIAIGDQAIDNQITGNLSNIMTIVNQTIDNQISGNFAIGDQTLDSQPGNSSNPVTTIGHQTIDNQISGNSAIGDQTIDSQPGNSSNPVTTIGHQAIYSQIIDNSSKIYTTLVDHMHGFHIVYEADKNGRDILVENYKNNTLNINIGDTVLWSNDAVPETELTILSKENLWNTTCGQYLCPDLRWNYKKFGYTFNKSGIYKIYIKEFPIFNQTIIVRPLEPLSNSSPTSNTTKHKYLESTISSTANKITKQNSTLNKTDPVSNVKNFSIGSDTIILVIVLFSMVVLSGRIKDE